MMTTFEKIIKNLNRIERELVKPEAERRDILPTQFTPTKTIISKQKVRA